MTEPRQFELLRVDKAATTLEAVLEYALYVTRHLTLLQQDGPDADGKLETFVDKVVAETALLILLAHRVPCLTSGQGGKLDELASLVSPYARSDRNAVMMMRFPQSVPTLGFAHIALTGAGYSDAQFDKVIRQCMETGQVVCFERIPFRFAELLWQHEVLGVKAEYSRGEVDGLSIASTSPNPCFGLREQAYQLTHALMYATDFGRDPRQLRDRQQMLMRTLDGFLTWTSTAEDFDLVCELLVGIECLGGRWSPAALVAGTQVWQTWSRLGYVPDINYDEGKHRSLTGSAATAYAIRRTYHTTYVLGILSALVASRDRDAGEETCEHLRGKTEPEPGAALCAELRQLATRCDDAVARTERYLKDAEAGGARGREQTIQIGTAPSPSREHCADALPRALLEAASAAPICGACATALEIDCSLVLAVRSYDLVRFARLIAEVAENGAMPSSGAAAAIAFATAQQLPTGEFGAYFLPAANQGSEASALLAELMATSLQVSADYLRRGVS
ncbi:MAG TPA: hypothetical protein VKC63_10815 [Solirubrobacterales bacterium]|nr:hypothetical protein [Solirubrobacterales bacterium]